MRGDDDDDAMATLLSRTTGSVRPGDCGEDDGAMLVVETENRTVADLVRDVGVVSVEDSSRFFRDDAVATLSRRTSHSSSIASLISVSGSLLVQVPMGLRGALLMVGKRSREGGNEYLRSVKEECERLLASLNLLFVSLRIDVVEFDSVMVEFESYSGHRIGTLRV